MLEGLDCAAGGRIGGQRCPQVDNAPETAAGQVAWRVTGRSGVWKYAGMAGAMTGLDLAEALATVAAMGGAADDDLIAALQAIERGAVKAARDAADEAAKDRERNRDHG